MSAVRVIRPREAGTDRYSAMDRMFPVIMVLAVAALLVSMIVSISIGEVSVPFVECYKIMLYKITGIGHPDWTQGTMSIVWLARMPRVVMAVMVGAGLALCGVVMQSSVQNPLADPYILGTSSGASLGATFVIMLGLSGVTWVTQIGVSSAAFVCASGAAILVVVIAGVGGRMTSVKLVLAGTVLNMVCSTFASVIVFLFPNEEGSQAISYWLLGSLASVGIQNLPVVSILIPVAAVGFFTQARIMNTMMLGDETAATLGVNINRSRIIYMVLSALLVGFMVDQCGVVGFVGLIIPHIARGIVGTDHKRLIPFSVLLGGLFLLWCDVVARSALVWLGQEGELPLGLITSLIGAPMLLYRIVRQGFASADM